MKLRHLTLHGLLIAAAMVSWGSAAGAAPVDDGETSQKAASGSGMPDTAEGYLKWAAEYDQRAKDLREEAQAHRVMRDDFIRKEPPNKTDGELPVGCEDPQALRGVHPSVGSARPRGGRLRGVPAVAGQGTGGSLGAAHQAALPWAHVAARPGCVGKRWSSL
jgi:hypothetical protein